MNASKNYFEVNKETWNQKAPVHAASDFYDMKAFIDGKSSLNQFELNALGNVYGKSLLHLQCHFGQDTLSWERLGAHCTGIDISDAAIKLAWDYAKKLQLNTRFICGNVLDTAAHVDKKFDIVFTSYGVLGWLPDLKPWGKMVSKMLKPGGTFYIVEFHPIAWMFDYLEQPPKLRFGYDQKEVIYEEYQGTYANKNASITSKEYTWNHGLGEIITSLTEAGLKIDFLNEYQESPYAIFPNMEKGENGLYFIENSLFPLLFEIKATKPEA